MNKDVRDLFKSELGEEAEKVLVDCPHCSTPITKSQVLAKAAGAAAPAKKEDVVAKSDQSEVKKVEAVPGGASEVVEKGNASLPGLGVRFVAGTPFAHWIDTGMDAYVADLCAKGEAGLGSAPMQPVDKLRSPTR